MIICIVCNGLGLRKLSAWIFVFYRFLASRSCVIIILKNIPGHTEKQQIEDFISPAIKGGLLRKSGSIDKIAIQLQKDSVKHTVEYHALVTITPDSAAIKAIKKLNKKRINGRHILVAEYHIRTWHNDPRINREPNHEVVEQRKGDRRRRNLETQLKAEQRATHQLFQGDKKFSRKLHDD